MSYRLDQGNGQCIYRIGVEDDGCHSLLNYGCIAETARILEFLARGLNAVVMERKIIQNEVLRKEDGSIVLCCDDNRPPVFVLEPSLLGDGHHEIGIASSESGDNVDGEMCEEKSTKDDLGLQLDKDSAFTRGEVTIQRIETHLLDPPPVSLAELAAESDEAKKAGDASSGKSAVPGLASGIQRSMRQKGGDTMSVGETLSSRNIRVAVVGNVDAGKSTMIGTLCSSCLDDGRGSSRTSIMKHRHEIESGRTSTATTHLMGFRSTGEPIAGRDQVRSNRRKSEDEVARESYRVITLMDLAGHEKYLKTT